MRNTVPASATAIIVALALFGVSGCGGAPEEAGDSGDAEPGGQLESGAQVEGAVVETLVSGRIVEAEVGAEVDDAGGDSAEVAEAA